MGRQTQAFIQVINKLHWLPVYLEANLIADKSKCVFDVAKKSIIAQDNCERPYDQQRQSKASAGKSYRHATLSGL